MATSKLFVPLAEEYIKNGMLEEAIQVLQEGLKLHPNYLGARVSLGKVYLQKGMVTEAVGEFEKVVQVSPDNIYSHKHLARLYRDTGRIQDAVSACETILVFVPKDQEATTLLTELLSPVRPPDPSPGVAPEMAPLSSDLPPSTEEKIDFISDWEIVEDDPVKSDTLPEIAVGEKTGLKTETDLPLEEEPFETETLADLYMAQGERIRGTAVYRKLLDQDPENE
ncbi:MAG: tetratricopeptide repeat protein, partial [Nitrospirae bacterium]|nr:tetratricopeptide repeat protein [Nitrospirota bacterium]